MSKFFHLRVDPILSELRILGKRTGNHTICLPLSEWRKNGGLPLYPKRIRVTEKSSCLKYF